MIDTGKYLLGPNHEAIPCISLEAWGDSFKERARWRVGSTQLGPFWVSTMFLGLDHQYGSGPPLLFETMVFHGSHGDEQWRYSTWDEALAGHARVVELVKRACSRNVREGRYLDRLRKRKEAA